MSLEYHFPSVDLANEDGLLAIGGDLHPNRLLRAYQSGIFPWYNQDEPICWYAPDPRMLLFFENLKVSKSTKQILRRKIFKVTMNLCFQRVIQHCATQPRKGQSGTWITQEMQDAYIALHRLGRATSFEVWQEDELVGGLYGVDLVDKKVFCGESMFSKVSNASKIAFIEMANHFENLGYKFVDCQVYNTHLESLGATEVPRSLFMELLM